MVAAPRNKVHSFHVSGVFEAGAQIGEPTNRVYAWQRVQSELSCAGINGDDLAEHDVALASFGSASEGLEAGVMYGIKAKLIGSNTSSTDVLYHEAARVIVCGPSSSFQGSLIDNTAVTSVGIIVGKETIAEPQYNGKMTTVVIVRHTDYDPVAKMSVDFLVEYRCRPVRNLENCAAIFQLGREASISGFIIDRREDSRMWVVEIYHVGICSGHEAINPRQGVAAGSTPGQPPAGGRQRLPKRNPGTPTPRGSDPNAMSSYPTTPGSTSGPAFTFSPNVNASPLDSEQLAMDLPSDLTDPILSDTPVASAAPAPVASAPPAPVASQPETRRSGPEPKRSRKS